MALGAADALGHSLERMLVITKSGHWRRSCCRCRAWRCTRAAHPVPDERSLAAGRRLLEWVDELPAAVSPLFLISGGASSLVEVLEPGVALAQLEQLSARGLAQGAADRRAECAPRAASRASRAAASRPGLRGRPARGAVHFGRAGRRSGGHRLRAARPRRRAAVDRIERQIVASVDRRHGGCCNGGVASRTHRGAGVGNDSTATRHASPRASPTSCSSAAHRSASGAGSRRCSCRRIPAAAAATSTWRSPRPGSCRSIPTLAAARGRHRRDATARPMRPAGLVDAETCARLALAGSRRRRMPRAGGCRHGARRCGRAGAHRPHGHQRGGPRDRPEAAAGPRRDITRMTEATR